MKQIAFYIGDSTGLKIVKNFIKKRIKINFIVSTEKKYEKIIKKISKLNNIKYYYYKNHNNNFIKLLEKTDAIISIFSRYIFPKKFIDSFKGTIFNIHPGLLPYYPGTNSVSGAIYNNEKYTGVTIHKVTEGIDKGGIVLSKKIKILKNEMAINVWQKIQIVAIQLAEKLYENILKNKIVFKKNVIKLKKKFPKFIPNDGIIIPNIDELNNIMILYRSSFYFPYKSPWGNLKILDKKKIKIINHIKIIKNSTKKFQNLKKINKNNYLIKLNKNKIIEVKTN